MRVSAESPETAASQVPALTDTDDLSGELLERPSAGESQQPGLCGRHGHVAVLSIAMSSLALLALFLAYGQVGQSPTRAPAASRTMREPSELPIPSELPTSAPTPPPETPAPTSNGTRSLESPMPTHGEAKMVGANDSTGCQTTSRGESCFKKVVWAKTEGIHANRASYSGLTENSTLGDFQLFLHENNETDCPKPCKNAFEPESCAQYGCFIEFIPGRPCQCNSGCIQFNSCCSDFLDICNPDPDQLPATSTTTSTSTITTTSTPFKGGPAPDGCFLEYNAGDTAACFCKLAGNRGCADDECSCPQGCSGEGVTMEHDWSVTFKNVARAEGCSQSDALLTIPKSYFGHVNDLKAYCPDRISDVLAEMIRGGFEAYHEWVASGPVKMCIHAAHHISVSWLHLHTVCEHGTIDHMSSTNEDGWCGVMSDVDEAEKVSLQIKEWILKASGQPEPVSTTCTAVGCGTPARPRPFCSCTKEECEGDVPGFCCPDYFRVCPHKHHP